MMSEFVCAWCDVSCRVERVQHDDQGREFLRDTCCAYCGRTELRSASSGVRHRSRNLGNRPMARRSKRRRKRKTMSKAERLAILAPYIRELERAKVPPSVIGQASALMVILLGEGLK
jgi:hypothetical protein